jgi:hypothetical protein
MAWAHPALGETALASTLYRAEGAARSAHAGLWADRINRVRNPSEAWADRGTFQIVEGRVYAAAVVRGTGYLNFAEDWRRDFTVALDRDALKRFEKAGINLADLEGRRVWAKRTVDEDPRRNQRMRPFFPSSAECGSIVTARRLGTGNDKRGGCVTWANGMAGSGRSR